MKSKVVNDDFYIYFGREYKEQDIATVVKLKNGIEFEIRNDRIYAIIIPNLIKQIPVSDFDKVEIHDINIDDDNIMHVALDVDTQIIGVQFDCTELLNQNI